MNRRTLLRRAALLPSWLPSLLPLLCLDMPRTFAASSTPSVLSVPARAPRVVVLDWGLVETLLAMGVMPVGVAEVDSYNASVVAPAVPPGVTDVGLRLAPSLELLQQLAPDLILINSSQESQREMLERIAPVRAFAVYTDAGSPYRRSCEVTLQLGKLCNAEAAAQALIDGTQHVIDTARARLAEARARTPASGTPSPADPLYLIRFFDGRHVGVYGARSVFQDVLDALALRNAWRGPTDYWGIGVAGLEQLAAVPDAALLYFNPLPAGVDRQLASNRLWRALPPVAAGRVAALPPFWGFGMLPSAARFATVLTDALSSPARLATPGTSRS
ncbi:Iron complex transport system substrate-binding protein [Paraburkholderia tropica]|uniref:ABC transporter substrate-binding protein n=1 Tax=Paraburkholderia tropica TaxID=92647 RepID=UPI001CB3C79B|nr:ABC transporter substrate-binding protein [Paraburkholderia tropica]CAG9226907.1 Iron complex transport system substrate-binding protein [Paraburkholderia tropica]